MKVDQLLQRAKNGEPLSTEERNILRAAITGWPSEDLVAKAIRALALSGPVNKGDVELVKNAFKSERADEWVLQAAIYALCNYWKLTSEYVSELIDLIDKRKWSSLQTASIAAIDTLGRYLATTSDPYAGSRLLQALLEEIENCEQASANCEPVRGSVLYRAVMHAVRGVDPTREVRVPFPEGIDVSVIQSARQKFSAN